MSTPGAETASKQTTGTVQDSNAGLRFGSGLGRRRTSSGESSGAVNTDGRRRVTESGLPGWSPTKASEDMAKGWGRDRRVAWLGLLTVLSESSPHRHRPRLGDQNPWTVRISGMLFQWPTVSSRRRSASCGGDDDAWNPGLQPPLSEVWRPRFGRCVEPRVAAVAERSLVPTVRRCVECTP
jgi:hypothetical protein